MKSRKKKLKKRIYRAIKALIGGIFIVFLSTVGIDAVDNRGQLRESMVARLFRGPQKALCPENMAIIDSEWGSFCIDIYENSSSKDCPHPKPASSLETLQNLDYKACLPESKKDAEPWTNLSQDQAIYACSKAGKRLPSNREWLKAALGTPDKAGEWKRDDCQVKSNWDMQPGLTGRGVNCVSFSGNYDMIGNVWEWTAGGLSDGRFGNRDLPPAGYVSGMLSEDGLPAQTGKEPVAEYYDDYMWLKPSGARTIARGGYWNNGKEAGQYSHYIVSSPAESGDAIGFRCAKDINSQ